MLSFLRLLWHSALVAREPMWRWVWQGVDQPLGMVSSAHPIATRAGLEILEAGGSAFDAAVAVAATLNVVEPMMSGMGGYGTILVYSSEEDRARFLNASDRIPRGVEPDLFRAPTPGYRENRRGAKAVSTPGNLRAWEAMSTERPIECTRSRSVSPSRIG